MKALIVDLRDGYAAALKENGTIVKIPDLNYFPGQSVELTEPDFEQEKKTLHKTRRFPKLLQKICTVAASAVFLSGIAAATAYALPYGTVSVDGEPSIAYTINCFDYVLGVEALNEEGEAVLSEMNLNDLRNHKVDTAVSRTLEQMEKDGYFRESESEIGIAAETQNDNHSEVLREKLENIVQNDMEMPLREDAAYSGEMIRPSEVEQQGTEYQPESAGWQEDRMETEFQNQIPDQAPDQMQPAGQQPDARP